MKIALIGYGAMGKLIKTLAEEKKHEIAIIVDEADAKLSTDDLAEKLRGVDAAIDFSTAEAVELYVNLVKKLLAAENTEFAEKK
jgi:4-hydroxy-tetrahydrodipicolinate reductase